MKTWRLVAVWVRSGQTEQEDIIEVFETYLEAKHAMLAYNQQLGLHDRKGYLFKATRIDGDYLGEHLRGN